MFERETCSRCGGSGQHSWCQMHGSRCFKCHGKGQTLTKRGRATAEYLTSLKTVSVMSLEPGDRFVDQVMVGPCQFANKAIVVKSITPIDDQTGSIGGVPFVTKMISVNTDQGSWHKAQTSTVVLYFDQEKRRQLLAQALEYQETLTKAGKRRKVRKSRKPRKGNKS